MTWRESISVEMGVVGDSWDNYVAHVGDIDVDFDCGYGWPEGKPFTLWTDNRVYFPVVYDGSEWVSSVPRNPCGEAVCHVGSY